jgi:hypothetical protein
VSIILHVCSVLISASFTLLFLRNILHPQTQWKKCGIDLRVCVCIVEFVYFVRFCKCCPNHCGSVLLINIRSLFPMWMCVYSLFPSGAPGSARVGWARAIIAHLELGHRHSNEAYLAPEGVRFECTPGAPTFGRS